MPHLSASAFRKGTSLAVVIRFHIQLWTVCEFILDIYYLHVYYIQKQTGKSIFILDNHPPVFCVECIVGIGRLPAPLAILSQASFFFPGTGPFRQLDCFRKSC